MLPLDVFFFLIIWINWFKRLWFRRYFVFLFSHFLFEISNIFDLRKTLGWPKPYFNYFCTWLNCNAFKTETMKHNKYVRSLKWLNLCSWSLYVWIFQFLFLYFCFSSKILWEIQKFNPQEKSAVNIPSWMFRTCLLLIKIMWKITPGM